MKKKNRLILVMLFAVLVFAAISSFVGAEETDTALELPVTVQIKAEDASSRPSVMFELTALNNAPLPQGADGSVYRFEMIGNSSTTLKFTFSETGIWRYHLSAKGLQGVASPSELILTVQVTTSNITVTAKDAEGKKCGLDFVVSTNPVFPDKPDTGDHSHIGWYPAAAGVSLLLVLMSFFTIITDSGNKQTKD